MLASHTAAYDKYRKITKNEEKEKAAVKAARENLTQEDFIIAKLFDLEKVKWMVAVLESEQKIQDFKI